MATLYGSRLRAIATSSVREEIPNLPKTCVRCVSTVRGEMKRRSAISRLRRPSATRLDDRSLRRSQALPSGRGTPFGRPSSATKAEAAQGRLHAGNVPGRAELLINLNALPDISDGRFPRASLSQRQPSRFARLGELVGSSDRPVRLTLASRTSTSPSTSPRHNIAAASILGNPALADRAAKVATASAASPPSPRMTAMRTRSGPTVASSETMPSESAQAFAMLRSAPTGSPSASWTRPAAHQTHGRPNRPGAVATLSRGRRHVAACSLDLVSSDGDQRQDALGHAVCVPRPEHLAEIDRGFRLGDRVVPLA